jgi:Protein of unknown function (DUF3305)
MATDETLPLGVVLERRKTDHPWQDFTWRPVGVVPGAPACDPRGAWKLLRDGDGWEHFHSGTLTLSLFRKETEAYKVNLSQQPPRIFVVLRAEEEAGGAHDYVPCLVTASPYEAQDYLDSGEEIVEAVPMPPDVVAFVQGYIDAHHVDEPFYKRKRKRHDLEQEGFARKPPDRARDG